MKVNDFSLSTTVSFLVGDGVACVTEGARRATGVTQATPSLRNSLTSLVDRQLHSRDVYSLSFSSPHSQLSEDAVLRFPWLPNPAEVLLTDM